MVQTLFTKAPCFFCRYNGPNFFQKGTHEEFCPWHHIGSLSDRLDALPKILQAMRTAYFKEAALIRTTVADLKKEFG